MEPRWHHSFTRFSDGCAWRRTWVSNIVHILNTILYISYDGLLEPLGESQVVNYVERLAADHVMTVLSFEKPVDLSDPGRLRAMEHRLEAHGVSWLKLRYHKVWPTISTGFDVVRGILYARAVCRRRGVMIVHARGYVSSLIALGARSASGARFLFDMRGFWVDEKVEAGHWTSGGILYRIGKWWERHFFRSADGIVSLTDQGVRALAKLGHETAPSGLVEVIPTCVDLQHFKPGAKDSELLHSLGLTGTTVVGCVGTMSNWYMRHEMLQYLAYILRSVDRARILIVTRENHCNLRCDAEQAGIPGNRIVFARADFADMPLFIRLFDVGMFFIRPVASKRGSAATKLAEFLACGVPVIINDGVGDSGDIVRKGRVGVVLPRVDMETFEHSLPDVRALLADREVASRCRGLARELFDVERGVYKYSRVYRLLSSNQAGLISS